jgi:putative SOS response-associated peptidase YedK
MCGRVRLSSDVSEIKLVFSIPPERPAPNFPPSWNVAPTDTLPVARYDTKAGQRSLDMLRWGLIRYWAGLARRGTGGPRAIVGAAGALPVRRHDRVAGQPARRQCQEQRPGPDRAACRERTLAR